MKKHCFLVGPKPYACISAYFKAIWLFFFFSNQIINYISKIKITVKKKRNASPFREFQESIQEY